MDGEGEIPQEACELDNGAESLVIRRILVAPKLQEEENWLRTNLLTKKSARC